MGQIVTSYIQYRALPSPIGVEIQTSELSLKLFLPHKNQAARVKEEKPLNSSYLNKKKFLDLKLEMFTLKIDI